MMKFLHLKPQMQPLSIRSSDIAFTMGAKGPLWERVKHFDGEIPLFRERETRKMKESIIYVHGKGGSAEEADHYKPLFPNCEVIGFDYRSQTPWEAKEEFLAFFAQKRQRCDRLILIAGSIGAFFSMSVLDETLVDRAYFISPVVDMENLIGNMMRWANVTKQELAEKKEIATDFGETLSWEYLCYVRQHPIIWNVPTCILYGEHDNLTSIETVSAFAKRYHAKLTVMPGGEHWFHTAEQMRFLDDWLKKRKRRLCR
jgi:pimeloyl-ACP methyl ester carboxylesterase